VSDLPYLRVPEWHATHGLHVHFAVGRYIRRSMIEAAWPRGFVHIKLIGHLPQGSHVRDEARIAARYLAKYVGKGFEDHENVGAFHRYDMAQGYTPRPVGVLPSTAKEVMKEAVRLMGGPTQYFWSSNDDPTWGGASSLYLSW